MRPANQNKVFAIFIAILLLEACSNSSMSGDSKHSTKQPSSGNVTNQPSLKQENPVDTQATPTPSQTSTSTPTPSPTPDPLGGNNGDTTVTIPPTAPKTIDFGNLWSAGDDGTYFYLNLDNGTWDWNNMNVYNPRYDNKVCQDYVGLIGDLNLTDMSGKPVTGNVNMSWRFNPSCSTLPKNFQGNAVLPGTWGTFVNLDTVSVTRTGGDGTMTITQVGRTLRFQVYLSLGAVVKITFKNK